MAEKTVTQINIRVPHELAEDLEQLAQVEHRSRIDIARQLLWEGIAHRKQEHALALYVEGKVSRSKAAEIAGISLWEMMDLIAQRRIPSNYTISDAIAEVKRLLAASGIDHPDPGAT